MQNIEEIYKEYSSSVYMYLFCLTHNKEIAKHLWFKELKKKKANISFEEINENVLYDDTLEDNYFTNEEKLKLFKDMQKLDEKSREVMYLRIMGNLSYDEIGEILGKTSNWSRVTFYRAKQKIKEENKNEQHKNLFDILQMTFTLSITTDNYDIGKEYYVIKDYNDNNYRNENWIDKDTGLTIRRITKNSVKTYFGGTNVLKNVSDCIEDYKYEFGNVTDDDVKIPDLSNYQIKKDNTINDLINKANKER